ncbi:MAG TPA: rRNA maturation RNase YbeY [Clostridia bacterium]
MKIISERNVNSLYKKIFKKTLKVLGQPKYLSVGLNFMTKDEIRELNKTTRAIDQPTDVLSYPNLDLIAGEKADKNVFTSEYDRTTRQLFLGEIVICEEIAASQAQEYGHSLKRELGFLFLHGLLHLLGYDHVHPEDEKVMRDLQDRILSELKIER